MALQQNAPRGFEAAGATLPTGQSQVRLTVTVPPRPRAELEEARVKVEGRATIDGREVVREAVAAEDMMQAFFYRHLVAADGLTIAVRRGPALPAPFRVAGPSIKLGAGGAARVRVTTPLARNSPIANLRYELSEAPEGISLQAVSSTTEGAELEVRCDAAKVKPGMKGNLIVEVSGERTAAAGNGRPAANRQRVPLGTLPALTYEVVEK